MEKDEIVDTLNDLIQIAEDSHEGYRTAAESARRPDLQVLFNDLAAQRGAMVRDLQMHVAEQGGAPEASGTFIGGAHRVFVGLKTAVLGHDPGVIIAEIDRGESEAIRRFEQALGKSLPPHLIALVDQHLERIKADRLRIAALVERTD